MFTGSQWIVRSEEWRRCWWALSLPVKPLTPSASPAWITALFVQGWANSWKRNIHPIQCCGLWISATGKHQPSGCELAQCVLLCVVKEHNLLPVTGLHHTHTRYERGYKCGVADDNKIGLNWSLVFTYRYKRKISHKTTLIQLWNVSGGFRHVSCTK